LVFSERRAQSLRDRAAAEERRKDAEFNQWLLFEQSDRTVEDALLYQPSDYELQACDYPNGPCDHPKGYHPYMDAQKEKARKVDEAKKVEEVLKQKPGDK
jgi:hypothetical protein